MLLWLGLGLATLVSPAAAQKTPEPNEPAASTRPSDSGADGQSGQSREPGAAQVFDDRQAGLRLRVPKGWRPAGKSALNDQPGDVRGVWTGPEGATLAVIVESGGESITPSFLLDLAVKGLERRAGAQIKRRDLVEHKGKRAVRLAWLGEGKPAPFGVERPRVYTEKLIVPLAARTVTLQLIAPQENFEAPAKTFERVLRSFTVRGEQSRAQREPP